MISSNKRYSPERKLRAFSCKLPGGLSQTNRRLIRGYFHGIDLPHRPTAVQAIITCRNRKFRRKLVVLGQIITVGFNELIHHLLDGIDIQLASSMGIQHGRLINVILFEGAAASMVSSCTLILVMFIAAHCTGNGPT